MASAVEYDPPERIKRVNPLPDIEANDFVSPEKAATVLNLNDPFEKILHQMVLLQRRKANDYAADGDKLKNMREVVNTLGIEGYDVVADCEAMVIRKTSRINNLRGREPSNESLRDSYLDRAIYAILAIVALDEQ